MHEEDSCEKLGWHLGFKATLRKGRMKELEEESKLKNCKKVLFDTSVVSKKEKPVLPIMLLCHHDVVPKMACEEQVP